MQKELIICSTLLIETSPQALPLGAACIASALKNDLLTKDKFEVKLISQSLEDFANRKIDDVALYFANILLEQNPKYLCFSVYVWNRNFIEQTAKVIKQKSANIVIIAGGPEVTANPLSFENFDYTISGAGEKSVPELINCLENSITNLPLGVYNKNYKICSDRSVFPNLSELSSPYLDGTLDVSEYGGALWELARGCPFKCSYCYESKGEKCVQYFSDERIEAELELFNKKNISQVFVLDPTYNANKQRALKILNLIAKKAPGMFFYFEARAEFIDKELALAFTKIPCALQIGLQSANPEVLKNVHRSLDKKKFEKNINYLNQVGAVFGFDLIYGLPGDTISGFKNSIDFALNLYPNNLETFCLSVLPGTVLFEDAKKFNMEYEQIPPYNVIKTPTYPQEEIERSRKISAACNIFYNQGRTVPWFISVAKFLHLRPSALIEEFAKWFCNNFSNKIEDFSQKCNSHVEVEKIQIQFLKSLLAAKQKNYAAQVVEDIVLLNGAISRVESESKEQIVKLNFHPDDLLSQYACDIQFFVKNAKKYNCKVRCFKNKNGIDWKVIK